MIRHIEDRPGHDVRYALSSAKVMRETGWEPGVPLEEGLGRTIEWYRTHARWLGRVRSGAYEEYHAKNYGHRS